MTNADCIRQMTDDELYKFLQAIEIGDIDYALTFCDLCNKEDYQLSCDECFKRWLFNDAYDFNGLLKDGGINSGYVKDEPQTEADIARAIIHKIIDDSEIAEDVYPDLRQRLHDAVDECEPQTEEEILREQCRDFMSIVEQTERSE